MLPHDWGHPGRGLVFHWPASRDELLSRYESLGSSEQLREIVRLADALKVDRVLVEAPYIDFDFRSEYSQHHARRFYPPPDVTERLLLMAGGELVGMSVVRPTSKPIGRTVIAVPHQLRELISVTPAHTVRAFGLKHEVRGVPFLSQDGEYARCAHAAIWAIARWAHLDHGMARQSMAAVVDAAGVSQLPDRTVASGGLSVQEVALALRRLGLPILNYNPSRRSGGISFEETMRIYLDSHFPIAINTPRHLTLLVGYGIRPDGTTQWIRSDDNVGPYCRVEDWNPGNMSAAPPLWPSDDLGLWQSAVVPLPGRIHVPAEAAVTASMQALVGQLQARGGPSHLLDPFLQGAFVPRTRVLRPAHHKVNVTADQSIPEAVRAYRIAAPAPAWAYVTEFARRDAPDEVIASVMIDATSDKRRPAPVVADIDGWCVRWDRSGAAHGSQETPRGNYYASRMVRRVWTEQADGLFAG